MDEEKDKQDNLLDTTDCLEAVGVFRGWKNLLFVIAVCCLVLLQVFFWLVNTGHVKVKADEPLKADTSAAVAKDKGQIEEAAKRATAGEPNKPAESTAKQVPQQKGRSFFGEIKFKNLARLVRFFNFLLIPVAALYCLTMLFSLKVSMLGRLGGINHICRAFFLSLIFLVLLLPWQRFFAGIVVGAMYTPGELSSSVEAVREGGVFDKILYYLRFTGYWLLVLVLLVFSQLRSARWSKAILRRLEVI